MAQLAEQSLQIPEFGDSNRVIGKQYYIDGRGGGQVVSVLAFYSDDPSSNPAEAYNFSCKICV